VQFLDVFLFGDDINSLGAIIFHLNKHV